MTIRQSNQERTTILHVVGRMQHGGVECWLMDLLRIIDQERFEFVFCTLNPEPGVFDDEIRSLGGSIVRCPRSVGLRKFSKNFARLLSTQHFDAVHSHVLFFSGYVLQIAARFGVPIRIAHAHSGQDDRGDSPARRLYRWVCRRKIHKYSTQGIGCSSDAADLLFPRDWRRINRYQVAPCATNLLRFRTSAHRKNLCVLLGIRPDAIIVGHTGSFRWVKNHEFLLDIAAAMIRARSRIHLLLIGDGPLRSDMEERACRLDILGNTTFVGTRDDVPTLLCNLVDLFLFPSRMEGLGMAVVEAQCAGIPSLVSDAVPKAAAIIDELVTFESLTAGADSWAKLALEMLDRPKFNKNEALKKIQGSRFDIAVNARHLSNLYAGRGIDSAGYAQAASGRATSESQEKS